MVIRSGIDPADFRACVTLIEQKLCEVAGKLGVPESQCADLDGLLTALPFVGRSRARAMLNGIQVSAADEHPAMAAAARYVSALAEDIWEAFPEPPHHMQPNDWGPVDGSRRRDGREDR
jgi:hypothetical protein